MANDVTDTVPLTSREDLIEWFAAGYKPKESWRVGTEHEKIPFRAKTQEPIPYSGAEGIEALLLGLQARLGWEAVVEGDAIIGLHDPITFAAISLEPGGQFELSGAPLKTIHETAQETENHLAHVNAVGSALGIRFLTLGHSPVLSVSQTPVMPKGRYRIMAQYMPRVGSRGLDMMFRTATVQANLDFSSEADMVRKLRVALSLQPIATALFANSPFADGKPSGFLSTRADVWSDVDRARTGMMPFAFEQGFGFEQYVDYALDVPMYFVKRGSVYHDVAGASFRGFLEGGLDALPGIRPTISDWANHLSTVFPEVRLKRYLEMRGADVGPPERINALAAFFVGVLYDENALEQAWEAVKGWSAADRQILRDTVPRLGLNSTVQGKTVWDITVDMLAFAREGLNKRALLNDVQQNEACFLQPLDEIVTSRKTPAEVWLTRFHQEWQSKIERVYDEAVF